jgi:hypothetical protein|tara:strand:- start:572 stop:679 length:108 start_codon:yes stop_codon:yes gene_type:complete
MNTLAAVAAVRVAVRATVRVGVRAMTLELGAIYDK